MSERPQPELSQVLAALAAAAAEPPASISLRDTDALAARHGLLRREVEIAALRAHVLPERYRRNHGTVGWEGQRRLLEATVGVVGAGGLGGWIIEGLARMGVGQLIVIDGDVFEENNLNRQAGCVEDSIGLPKASVLADRARQVNQATGVTAHVAWLTAANGLDLLDGAQVIVDALDSLPARFVLEQLARDMQVPLVHGAIAGYTGQVLTIYPDDVGLAGIYGRGPYPEHGVETLLGNPTATPMMIAAWQIQQVVKIIVGSAQGLLRNRLMLMDAQAGDVTILDLGE